jgi:CRISPR/Cas system-associated exonuclease Cas4 (RecB family)
MYLDQNRLQKTEQEINRITLRGYNESCRPDADLSKYRIGVYLLADYCPTDRYIYITKKMPDIALEETWNGLQGRLIEKVYTELYESASKFVIRASLRNLTFKRWLSSTARKIIKTREKEIDQTRDSLRRKPRPNEVKSFVNKLKILANY